MGFKTDLYLKVNENDRGFKVFHVPLIWQGRWDRFRVPVGFPTDLASVPPSIHYLLRPFGDGLTRAAVLHDYLHWLALKDFISHKDADAIFEKVLLEEGVRPLRASMLWAGVRIGNGLQQVERAEKIRLLKLLPVALVALAPQPVVWLWQRGFRWLETR